MYTREQAIEAVEFLTGQKVERINFKHQVTSIPIDSSNVLMTRDPKRVYFICSYDIHASVLNVSGGFVNQCELNLVMLDGNAYQTWILLNHAYPTFNESMKAGFVCEFMDLGGFTTLATENYRGFVTVVYWECFLSN